MFSALARRMLGPEYARLLYRLIAENAWQYRYHYAVALILMFIVSGMFAAVALLMRDVFNDVFIAEDPQALQWLAWVLAARTKQLEVNFLAYSGRKLLTASYD